MNRKFPCEICGLRYSTIKILKCHVKKRHPGASGPIDDTQPKTCPICSRYFKDPKMLSEHIQLHSSEKLFFELGNLFVTNCDLIDNAAKFQCEHCSKVYPIAAQLKAHHSKKHPDKPMPPRLVLPPIACYVCKRNFKSVRDRDSRMKVHAGEFVLNGFVNRLNDCSFRSKVRHCLRALRT